MMRPYRRPILAGGNLLALLLITSVSASHAQLIGGHDSNAPVDFAADRIEVQDRADRVQVSGHVVVTQTDLKLTADRMTVAYDRSGGVEINRMDAIGNVIVTRGRERATGDVAIYDLDRKLITMVGHVTLAQGESRLSGGRLLIDLNTGRSSVDGHAAGTTAGTISQNGGRVTGTFKVKQQAK